MKKALVKIHNIDAGILEKIPGGKYRFTYLPHYQGEPVSLTMPTSHSSYEFKGFPPFFEGLLPEGNMLEALLRKYKLDRKDYFGQLLQVGEDLVGAVTVKEML